MGKRDHDPAVDSLPPGRHLTVVGGVREALLAWRQGAERLCTLGAMGCFHAAPQLPG
jgi:hypothetical protein